MYLVAFWGLLVHLAIMPRKRNHVGQLLSEDIDVAQLLRGDIDYKIAHQNLKEELAKDREKLEKNARFGNALIAAMRTERKAVSEGEEKEVQPQTTRQRLLEENDNAGKQAYYNQRPHLHKFLQEGFQGNINKRYPPEKNTLLHELIVDPYLSNEVKRNNLEILLTQKPDLTIQNAENQTVLSLCVEICDDDSLATLCNYLKENSSREDFSKIINDVLQFCTDGDSVDVATHLKSLLSQDARGSPVAGGASRPRQVESGQAAGGCALVDLTGDDEGSGEKPAVEKPAVEKPPEDAPIVIDD